MKVSEPFLLLAKQWQIMIGHLVSPEKLLPRVKAYFRGSAVVERPQEPPVGSVTQPPPTREVSILRCIPKGMG